MSNEHKEAVYIAKKPHNGIYGAEVYDTFRTLVKSIEQFVPDHAVGAHIKGTCSNMRAKAKIIELHAKALVAICNSVQPDRQ